MPFCTQCGVEVADADIFCAKCGARQGARAKAGSGRASQQSFNDFLNSISPRVASLLCYIPVIGWIASVVVLATNRFRANRIVRFHAFQGLYLFVAWLIVENFIGPVFHLWHLPWGGPGRAVEEMLKLALIGTWIFMLIKTSHEQLFRLPILGELAERSVAEQR